MAMRRVPIGAWGLSVPSWAPITANSDTCELEAEVGWDHSRGGHLASFWVRPDSLITQAAYVGGSQSYVALSVWCLPGSSWAYDEQEIGKRFLKGEKFSR